MSGVQVLQGALLLRIARDRAVAKNDTVEKPNEANKKQAEPTKTQSGKFDPAQFFQESREELSKVVWPSRQQLISESVSVVLMVVLSASLIYLIDGLFSWAAGQVFK
jgi:preprotein translocase subunit SecE